MTSISTGGNSITANQAGVEPVDDGMGGAMVLILYIIAFLFFFIGIIVGLIFLMGNSPQKKVLGRNIISVAILGLIFYIICWFFWAASYWAANAWFIIG
jgi:hypothetical protein